MSSIFSGLTGLRHQFCELLFSDLADAIDKDSSVLLVEFKNAGRFAFLRSSLSDGTDGVDAQLLLVNPDAPDLSSGYKLPWMKMYGISVINYGTDLMLDFDAKTRIYVYIPAGTASQGSLSIATWG